MLSLMKIIFRILVWLLSFIAVIVLLYFNFNLHTGPRLENKNILKKDVILQLNFLEGQLKKSELGKKMQKQYPEGFVFINVLYGLTWCEIARCENTGSEGYARAIAEARYAFRQIRSEEAKKDYDAGLLPAYGIFYMGWQNYLLGKLLSAQTAKDSLEADIFKANCNEIADAISAGVNPFPESYRQASWPADAFVAVASLKLHDRLFDKKYDSSIQNWILKVKAHLDPYTQLVPHAFDYTSGKISEGARGSSVSLILLFLSEIDTAFAKQQFENYKKCFLINHLGLLSIREYPVGKEGSGDVDSGPVILDMSFPGTIVSVGTFQKFGEIVRAARISSNIESFGLGHTFGNEKKFLLGKFPIADAFIAWSRMQFPDKAIEQNKNSNEYTAAICFHLLSALFILLVLFVCKKVR